MSQDRDDAAFYQEHKDDPELWGEPEESPPATSRRNLDVSVTVRFTAEEADLIRRLAREAGVPYSEIVRRAVRTFARPHFVIDADHLSHSLFVGNRTEQPGQQRFVLTSPDPMPSHTGKR